MGWFSPKMIIIYIKCIFHIDGYRWFSPYVLEFEREERKERINANRKRRIR